MTDDRPSGSLKLQLALRAAAGLLLVAAFWGVGQRYEGFRIPYGVGVQEIDPGELVFSFWYLGLGLPAVILIAWALDATRLPERVVAGLRGLADQPRLAMGLALVAAFLAVLARALVLQHAPVADDEATYVFIARTLLAGHVVNPPPGDAEFFRNQFVILNDSGWYGKYPIGHPLLLAFGEALGLRALVAPALTAAALLVTLAIGRMLLPRHQALLGGALLLVSPQFLLTGATDLSQTTSTLCLLVSIYALLRLDRDGAPRFAAMAGAALGFGVLTRPFPGALFALVAGVFVLVRLRGEPLGRWVGRLAALGAPALSFGVLLLLTQYWQTQDVTQSTYGAYHGAHHTRGALNLDWVATSFAGALLRQNLWLFGWPLSFSFLPFARRHRGVGLLWAMIGAEYAYRVLIPKTVVASTGPIYVAEIVPLLALLSASGMAEAAAWLKRHAVDRGAERIAGVVMAGSLVACLAFLPVHLRELRRGSDHWLTVGRLLDAAGAGESVVFAQHAVDVQQLRSWAYYLPNPSPDLSDERIFVRLPTGPDGPRAAYEFWRRRFPDRQAWIFGWIDGEPRLQQMPARLAAAPPLAR